MVPAIEGGTGVGFCPVVERAQAVMQDSAKQMTIGDQSLRTLGVMA
jgi:hypothetical protein